MLRNKTREPNQTTAICNDLNTGVATSAPHTTVLLFPNLRYTVRQIASQTDGLSQLPIEAGYERASETAKECIRA